MLGQTPRVLPWEDVCMNDKKNVFLGFLLSIVVAVSWFFIYAFLHEFGHAIFGWLYGGEVDNFHIVGFDAHISFVPSSFGPVSLFGQALIHSGGVLFPIVTGIISLCFYRPGVKSYIYHLYYKVIGIALPTSLFPWVGVPIISLYRVTSEREDATWFLRATESHFHPLFVTLGTILIILGYTLFAFKKGVYGRRDDTGKMIWFDSGGTAIHFTDVLIAMSTAGAALIFIAISFALSA